jgi:hypothetical protein
VLIEILQETREAMARAPSSPCCREVLLRVG